MGFQRHVAGSLHRSFVPLFEQDGAYQPYDGGLVWEVLDNVRVPLDIPIKTLGGIVRVNLRPAIFWEDSIVKGILLGLIQKINEFLNL